MLVCLVHKDNAILFEMLHFLFLKFTSANRLHNAQKAPTLEQGRRFALNRIDMD
jgi:hypothetical protein